MAEKTNTPKFENLASALVEFQKKIPVPKKESTADTGKYSYDYASLDKLTPLIFEALTKVGLAYSAVPDIREDGIFGLRATLMHESGETLSGYYPLGNPNNPAQAIGSAVTYARRYALLSMTGVAPTGEDDDGERASIEQAKAATPAVAKVSSVQELRTAMGEKITANAAYITGDDANTIMNKITGDLPPSGWTAAHLRKASPELDKLIEERKKAV